MSELLTAAQMRAIEMAAIESGEVTGLELMERAGRGVVEAIFEEWPELAQTSHRAVVLCGPGNNGGDGFVVARLLKEWGWEVEVFLYGDGEKLPPDAKVNYEQWCELGSCGRWEDASDSIEHFPDLVIDAVFGTGLTRQIGGEIQNVLAAFSQQFVVSIDLPSGTDSDSGKLLIAPDARSDRLAPAMSVVFHREKIGCRLGDGSRQADKVVVADIGLGDGRCPAVPPGDIVKLVDGPSVLLAKGGLHKFSHGHAFILTGSAGRTGAARLAARGALRVGAGLVTLGVPGEAMVEVAAQITGEMMREVVDGAALRERLQDQRINAVCLGPGLGLRQAEELVPVALEAGRATVLDADALTAFAEDPQVLFDMLHGACVLTPHGGEFARLFPDIAEKLAAPAVTGPAFSKVDATREAAKRAGCVVLYKGADTVIAAPDGRCAVHAAAYERAAPWLATAGAGDVLAGIITGLLARGFPPMQAAETGAWLHVEAARVFGPGLIAEDLPEMLPKVLRDLGVA
ncbi:NAD(P)H-hydrate dehydratase [Shimia sp. FJ5]|uniref:NAD(P)H-hydrate dehydratase n=1 Tax=Shimia sp. FJ5 TaxID=3079054 RepID=UPI00293DC086|nr:NAD(P)H-hydrate dehydratase [Shimia sp. FJ5]MDV4145557.1 NAD(P)H-hydrate dehydratase [Shimia sp. FJ5]